MTKRNEHLEQAIAAAPGIVAFAKALGVTHQAVSAWRKKGHVSLVRAAQIETLYGVSFRLLVSSDVSDTLLGLGKTDGSDVL
ncbi:MAG: helix-turn-helix domain-containing protein [Patescibacteria group bacterium]|nr:helix-turn-helix domain-containing protein [Patescibacteria group bacterium]